MSEQALDCMTSRWFDLEDGEVLCARCDEPYDLGDTREIEGERVCLDCEPPSSAKEAPIP